VESAAEPVPAEVEELAAEPVMAEELLPAAYNYILRRPAEDDHIVYKNFP
jgi:hypothetical protein